MMEGKNDIIKNQIMQLDQESQKSLLMHDFRWMPSLEVKLNIRRDEIDFWPDIMVDFFKNMQLDLDMLENYISIVLNIHKKVDGEETSYKFPMKYCTGEMYSHFNIDPPKNIDKVRLCPAIPKEDEMNYKVYGFMSEK